MCVNNVYISMSTCVSIYVCICVGEVMIINVPEDKCLY